MNQIIQLRITFWWRVDNWFQIGVDAALKIIIYRNLSYEIVWLGICCGGDWFEGTLQWKWIGTSFGIGYSIHNIPMCMLGSGQQNNNSFKRQIHPLLYHILIGTKSFLGVSMWPQFGAMCFNHFFCVCVWTVHPHIGLLRRSTNIPTSALLLDLIHILLKKINLSNASVILYG